MWHAKEMMNSKKVIAKTIVSTYVLSLVLLTLFNRDAMPFPVRVHALVLVASVYALLTPFAFAAFWNLALPWVRDCTSKGWRYYGRITWTGLSFWAFWFSVYANIGLGSNLLYLTYDDELRGVRESLDLLIGFRESEYRLFFQ